MIQEDIDSLKKECLSLVDYYLKKTHSIMKLYQDTAESQYFLLALKGTKAFIESNDNTDIFYLKKCINGLIAGQKGREGHDRLSELRFELEEELTLLKLRYNLN